MSLDKNKLSAEATRFLQKGQLDRAIKSYERILQADPSDTRALLKIAEIQQKKGDVPGAAATFTRVAEAYSDQGFFLKSVAVFKQVLKLAPDEVRVIDRLAQLYQQLGLVSEAMAQLHAIVRWAEEAGDAEKLLEALRRVVEIDPDHVPSSVKLGELYARLSQPKLAVEHLRRAADHLKRNSRLDEYAKVAERIATLVPDDHGLAREVASLLLARGDARRALQKLQPCYRADPRHLETLTMLAAVFDELGQDTKTAAVFREIGRLHEDEGRRADATQAWRRVAELEPDDPEALEALAAVPAPAAPMETAGQGSAAPRSPARDPATPAGTSGAGTLGDADAVVAKLLGETDVYVKYGLHDKALEHLQKVFAIDPDHVDGREKASRIREARKDLAGAADDQLRAVHGARARGLVDRARAGFERLRGLSPEHPEIAQLALLLAAPGAVPSRVPDADEGVILEFEELADAVIEVEPENDAAAVSARVPREEAVTAFAPQALSDDVALSAATSSGEEIVEEGELPSPAPDVEAILDDDRGTAKADENLAIDRGDVDEHVAAPASSAAEEDLAEADFFLSQGLLDEAREVLAELAKRHPQDPAIAARSADLERAATSEAPSAPRALVPPAPAPEYLYSVRDVLEPFKKGIEQTITPADSQTHYDLAIAYKEMGLLSDAIHEFEVALEGSAGTRRIDCLSLIGICQLESGDHAAAIQAYRTALASAGMTDGLRHAIEYQLATAYEAAGDPDVALHFLNGLLAAVPEYRDVAARVARLGGGPGHPPADGANPADPAAGTTESVRHGR